MFNHVMSVNGQVNFSSVPMIMFKPFKKVIRRRFEPGIWLRFRASSHQKQLHFKVHHFQVAIPSG